MIKDLLVENFKSIKSLNLSCKKINVFIGEPNAGKSNIIEALAMFSAYANGGLSSLIRFRDLTDLFFDNQISSPIKIDAGIDSIQAHFNNQINQFEFKFSRNKSLIKSINVPLGNSLHLPFETSIRLYKFDPRTHTNDPTPGRLSVPYGNNLVSILISNQEFRKLISDLFRSKGFRLNIKPVNRELEISKEINDEIYSYPFSNISETLKRVVFMMACLETNQNSTLLFDEPEANTFPFFTKYLAERISKDESNQYFITTHNPYLLDSIVAKTAPENLNIAITYMSNYETKVRVLNETEVTELMDMDAFFNLDKYLVL